MRVGVELASMVLLGMMGVVYFTSQRSWGRRGGVAPATRRRTLGSLSGVTQAGPRLEAGGLPSSAAATASAPRILTILTTYDKRLPLVKAYREAVSDVDHEYQPKIFVVSNEREDGFEAVDGIIDYEVGPLDRHRANAAIAEAVSRYEGTFDWIALGDDDTVFMYNRAMSFLSHIDHTKPLIIGRVDGLNRMGKPRPDTRCYTREEKARRNWKAMHGCCKDFTNPCKVPAFPVKVDPNREYKAFKDYRHDDLFWPYGGSGTFISAGMAVKVVGAEGWAQCDQRCYGPTDIQVGECLKMYGYSIGAYSQGFTQTNSSDPNEIERQLAGKCQILGMHLGVKHLPYHEKYTPETFGAAVKAVREVDIASSSEGASLEASCPYSWAAVSSVSP